MVFFELFENSLFPSRAIFANIFKGYSIFQPVTFFNGEVAVTEGAIQTIML